MRKDENEGWRDTAFLPLPRAAEVLGCSRSRLYSARDAGEISFRRVMGRTVIPTGEIIAIVDGAKAYTPKDNPEAQERSRRARTAA